MTSLTYHNHKLSDLSISFIVFHVPNVVLEAQNGHSSEVAWIPSVFLHTRSWHVYAATYGILGIQAANLKSKIFHHHSK
jgi:hypothetical protein